MTLTQNLKNTTDSLAFSQESINGSIAELWKKGTDFLGCPLAILGGAMSWISNHSLVGAISNGGGFGVLAGGALSPEDLRKEIQKTKEVTSQPFGVNLIVFHHNIQKLMEVCSEEKVSHVFLGGGIPGKEKIFFLKNSGIKVVGFAPSLTLARRLISFGIDALVVEGHEAGGHVGPISTTVLCQEILGHFSLPIFVAGGIGQGRSILSCLLMGAAGCQLGTRFACAKESCAHKNFKEAFFRAQSKDATLSVALDPRFPVIPVRSLNNEGKKEFLQIQRDMISAIDNGAMDIKEAQQKIELFWAGALRRAVVEGDVQRGSLMAGQSVSFVTQEESCADILKTLHEDMKTAWTIINT